MEGEKEDCWFEKCKSVTTCDGKCKRLKLEVGDGNDEQCVKLHNRKSSKATHSYRLMRLKTENEKLYASIMCKQCNVTQVQVLTLPCAHVAICEECSELLETCPLCEERILGTVRIFMAERISHVKRLNER